MISLSTAKLLLFVALCLGPKYGDNNHTIEIVNRNSYIVWTQNSTGWTISQKGLSSDDWPQGTTVSTQELNEFSKQTGPIASDVSSHNWSGKDSILHLQNGDVVEKHGDKAFYTINAGSYNQQVFTILTMQNGRPL